MKHRISGMRRKNSSSNNYHAILMCLCGLIFFSACTSEDAQDGWEIKSHPMESQKTIVKKETTKPSVVKEDQTTRSKSSELKNAYLILTKWHQNYPFNKALPIFEGNRVLAGCVNIAVAQLLYYHRYPLQGHGIIHHQWKDQSFTSVLNRQIHWEKMPLVFTPETPDYAIDEMAALIRDISMMNQTQFGIGANKESSKASLDVTGFINHFGFSDEMQQIRSENPHFFDIIDQELNEFRPVLLSIEGEPIGHMAIIDGKMDREGIILYHVNMGWGGHHNRFYDLRSPIVLESKDDQHGLWDPYIFTNNLIIYAPIKPCPKESCLTIKPEHNDKIRKNKIRGSFDTNIDQDRYENIFLKGATSIEGERGFGNKAFYIFVYNRFYQLETSFVSNSKTIHYTFKPDIYHVCASLCQNMSEDKHCFEWSPYSAHYHIQINTGVMSKKERKEIRADTGPPVFQNQLKNIILPRGFKEHIVRMNVFHPMGLPVTLSVDSDTDLTGIQTCLDDHFLILTNKLKTNKKFAQIIVTAETKGFKEQETFNLIFSGKRILSEKRVDIPGKFKNQNAMNKHRVILENECRITGYNGYKTQAFYFSIYDKFGQVVVPPVDKPINQYFDRGIYEIRTALRKEQNSSSHYYQYQRGEGDQYLINAYCPELTDDMVFLLEDNEDTPPEFQEEFNPIIIGENADPFTLTIDVFDPDGDEISISAGSDHPDIGVQVKDNLVTIEPHSPGVRSLAEITVCATANNKQTKKTFPIFVAENDISMGQNFELSGVFGYQDDVHFYAVILSGDCKISGDNGYSKPCFYYEILDHNKDVVIPDSNYDLVNYFNGLYYIKTSLSNSLTNRYYEYTMGDGDKYTVSVSCPDIVIEELDIRQMLWPLEE